MKGNNYLCCLWLFLLGPVSCFNIDVDNPVVYNGPKDSLFGYSVVQHQHGDTKWIVAGAPRLLSSLPNDTNRPGGLFKCLVDKNLDGNCSKILLADVDKTADGECGKPSKQPWLGASLVRLESGNMSDIVVCAHRHSIWKHEKCIIQGFCHLLPSDLDPDGAVLMKPCPSSLQQSFDEGGCQAGASATGIQELVFIGDPRASSWFGSITVMNTTSQRLIHYRDKGGQMNSYFGYAVAAGHFPHPNSKVVAAGAPRINGTVILLSFEDDSLKKYQEILGTQLGAYFGAVLCLVDLNSDGMDDLLVGAPQYTEIRDEGRVYVYVSNAGKMQETTQLAGSHAYNAHFGTAIESLGDINDDGFQDVAIGAPQEDDFHGVVYIYQGDDGGIVPHYSQRIFGRKISTSLKMFGQSISGGKDMDGNGYNDMTVGSFADAVVLLRSREIQIISATVHLPSFTKRIPQACVENGVSMICLNMTVCFKKLKGTGTTVLEYTLQENVDTNHQPRLGFPGQPKVVRCLVNRLVLQDGSSSCRRHMGIVQENVDFKSPLKLEMSYNLVEWESTRKSNTSNPPAPLPILSFLHDTATVKRQTVFVTDCVTEDCAADLSVEGKIFLPRTLQEPKTLLLGKDIDILLSITVHNRGSPAHAVHLTIHFPTSIKFLRASFQDGENYGCDLKPLHLICKVLPHIMESNTKWNASIVFDASALTILEEELTLSYFVTSKSQENNNTLEDNAGNISVALRTEAHTILKGLVSPQTIYFGEPSTRNTRPHVGGCATLNLNLKVSNHGPSPVPASIIHFSIPNELFPGTDALFTLVNVKIRGIDANCSFKRPESYLPSCANKDEEVTEMFSLNIFNSLWMWSTKYLDCRSSACHNFSCHVGLLPSGESVPLLVHASLNTSILKKDNYARFQFQILVCLLLSDSHHETIGQPDCIQIDANAVHEVQLIPFIIISTISGLLIFCILVGILAKVGFFKRKFKPHLRQKQNME